MTFKAFYEKVKELNKSFPNLKSWILWYLQEDRAPILFPACKALTKYDVQKFNSLKKDMNAQVGLGGLLQSLSKYKKIGLYYICNTAFRFISTFNDNLYEAMEGVGCKFGMPTKIERKRVREEQKITRHLRVHIAYFHHTTKNEKQNMIFQFNSKMNITAALQIACFNSSCHQIPFKMLFWTTLIVNVVLIHALSHIHYLKKWLWHLSEQGNQTMVSL